MLLNNKVGAESTAGSGKELLDGKVRVDSLIKVVACYRQLASCVGGCTDSLQLRDELRQTREKAQKLSEAICHNLTSHLRDKSLPEEQRREMELLWVAFSCSLELLHSDMSKAFHIADIFSLANAAPLVQTGLQGGGSEVAGRALSLPDLNQDQTATPYDNLEREELITMEQEISYINHMIDDMETKVNVLRWIVEPRGPQYAEPISSTDSASLALLSIDEERPAPVYQPLCMRSDIFVLLLLLSVVFVATILSVCVFLLS